MQNQDMSKTDERRVPSKRRTRGPSSEDLRSIAKAAGIANADTMSERMLRIALGY